MGDESAEEQCGRADDEVRKNLPQGVKLVRTLRGHTGAIGCIAWSSDGRLLASPSTDGTIRLWDAETGECLSVLEGHKGRVNSAAFGPADRILASGSNDHTVKLWETASGKLLQTLEGHRGRVNSVAFDPAGSTLASGSHDTTVKLWETASGKLLRTLEGLQGWVFTVAFDPQGFRLAAGGYGLITIWEIASGRLLTTLDGHQNNVFSVSFAQEQSDNLASGSWDKTIMQWETSSGRLLRTFEGHTAGVGGLAFLPNGQLIASKGSQGDDTIRLWNPSTGVCLVAIPELGSNWGLRGLVFHPCLPLLATVGSDPGTPENEYLANSPRDCIIHIYELDLTVLLGQPAAPTITYTSAKIVLVGDSGVGKTGLGWRLAHGEFKEHPSTHGQQFWLLNQLCKQRRDGAQCEAVLWDLAGQPDYRLIHALFLDDVDLALVLFGSTHDEDPLSGVEFWLKQFKTGTHVPSGVPKMLIAARSDRGTPRLTQEEMQVYCQQHDIAAYLLTSAYTGEGIDELIQWMRDMIPWDAKPATVTTETFKKIKDFVDHGGQIKDLYIGKFSIDDLKLVQQISDLKEPKYLPKWL